MQGYSSRSPLPATAAKSLALCIGESGSCLLSCLLGSDLHCTITHAGLPPSPARWGFPGTATLFVMAFAVCDVFLIYHYNLVDFCLSSRILVFCERIFCGFFCHYFHGQARPGRSKGAGQAVEILGHDPGGTGLPPLAIELRMVYDCKNTRMPDTAEKRSLWTDRISP